MRNQTNTPAGRSRWGRGCVTWLGGALAVLLLLALAGAVYEPIAEARDTRAYPPPGRMIDVGGYRLHLHCTGSGSPTVVVDAGHGDSSAGWGWVQPEVAKTTRICTYDRAGMGWSEPSPQPRAARQYAGELHTLLANANEPGPYVLVGHSMGGFTARVFAHDYPDEVLGLVLVDAQQLPAAGAAASPAPKRGSFPFPALLARIGLVRLLAGPLGVFPDLPEKQEQQAYAAFAVTPRSVPTAVDEFLGMSEGGAQARAVTSLGALPLIVLTRGKDQSEDWMASQAGFLQLSANSRQRFADRSGHTIPLDQPDAVVAAIREMVEQVRR